MEIKTIANTMKIMCAGSPQIPKTRTKIQVVLWGIILVLTLTLSLLKFDTFQVGTYIDDANYVILARSFISSPYYGLFNEPMKYKQAQFPFGFPLLLTIGAFLFPGNLEVMKVYSLIATLLNISILFWGWRLLTNTDSYWMGLAVAGLYGVFPLVIQHSTMVMSEAFFLTFYLLAIVLTEQAARNEEKSWWIFGMSSVIFFVIFTRTIGIIFVICIFTYLLFIRGWRFYKQLASVLVGVVILTSLLIYLTPVNAVDLLPAEYLQSRNANAIKKLLLLFSPVLKPLSESSVNPSNVGQPTQTVTVVPVQTTPDEWGIGLNPGYIRYVFNRHIAMDLREVILPFGEGGEYVFLDFLTARNFLKILGFLVSVIVLLGFIHLLIHYKVTIFISSSLVYFSALMLWEWEGSRLLYPILPQMQYLFLIGLGWIIFILTSSTRLLLLYKKSYLILVAFIIVLGSISIYKSLRIDYSYFHAGDIQSRTDWLKVNIENNANIMTEYPEVDYIYSGRKTTQYPTLNQISSPDTLEAYLATNHVNYILVAPQIIWLPVYSPGYSERVNSILPFIEELTRKSELTMVYASKQNLVKVYKRPN